MALPESGFKLIAQNAAVFIADMDRAGTASEAFADAVTATSSQVAHAQTAQDRAVANAAGMYQDAAGKWRTASGQFASSAEKAAAGIIDSSDDVAKQGGKGYKSFEEVASGALRKVGEMAVDYAAQAGAAIVQFVGDSIGQAGDFEAGMNRFGAVVGSAMDDSGQSLESFSKLFLKLGADTQYSAAQAQDAAINLAKGGIDPATIAAGGLEAALNLAAAGELDLAQAAEITAKQYGVWVSASASAAEKAAFLAESADLLSQAANASTVDVDDLALGLSNAGGVAKVSGLSFRETVTTMALLAPGFSSAADAGTSFKTFLTRLIPTTDAQASAMAKLGLLTADGSSAFYDATGSFIGMEKAAGLLQNATKGLTNEQKQMALQAIFGSDALRAGAILAEQGADGYDRMAGSMSAAGTAAEQAAARNKGFNFALESAKGSLENFGIVAGSLALPALTDLLTNAVIPLINGLTDFASALADPTTMTGQWASVLSSLLVPSLEGLAAATVAYAATQLPVLITAVTASSGAFMAQAAAIAATMIPLAAVAVAVAGVAWAYNDYNSKIATATQKLLESKSWWEASTQALDAYKAAQLETNPSIAAAAATVESLRAQIEQETEALGRRMTAGQESDAQYATDIAHINTLAGSLQAATTNLDAQTQASVRTAAAGQTATAAAATMGTQTEIMGGQVALTADEVEKLGQKIQDTYQKGGEALGAYVTTEATFLDGVEQRQSEHATKIAALEAQKQQATTAEQQKGINDQIAALNQDYADQEAAQAASYAEQQAAQQAHLGQMLIDYTVSQATLGNISKEKAAEITAALAEQYGLQESDTATIFLHMAGSIDEFASSSSSNIGDLIGTLEDQQAAAVDTEQAMTSMSKEYVATAVANFVEKGGEAADYAEKLRSIPKRVDTEVHTTYTNSGDHPGKDDTGPPGKAIGGPVTAAQLYLVGEQGPEFFVPETDGRIIPASQTRTMLRMAEAAGGAGARYAQPATSISYAGGTTYGGDTYNLDLRGAAPGVEALVRQAITDINAQTGRSAQIRSQS
jgi:TP901 family phage tail tape measure protein